MPPFLFKNTVHTKLMGRKLLIDGHKLLIDPLAIKAVTLVSNAANIVGTLHYCIMVYIQTLTPEVERCVIGVTCSLPVIPYMPLQEKSIH